MAKGAGTDYFDGKGTGTEYFDGKGGRDRLFLKEKGQVQTSLKGKGQVQPTLKRKRQVQTTMIGKRQVQTILKRKLAGAEHYGVFNPPHHPPRSPEGEGSMMTGNHDNKGGMPAYQLCFPTYHVLSPLPLLAVTLSTGFSAICWRKQAHAAWYMR